MSGADLRAVVAMRRTFVAHVNAMRTPLPILEALPALHAALATHANVVLQAPPGAGKSTGVPLSLLHLPWLQGQRIVMLEPRRLAARAVASRMAQLLEEEVGRTVGYRTRLESRVGAETRIEVVTEGILTRWLQRDAALEGVAIVIFDEFHERSLQADLGLALCLDVQETLREDLKLLVMSATLDTDALVQLLQGAPLVASSGLAHEVEVRWSASTRATSQARRAEQDCARLVAATVRRALEEERGDVLAFLPGQGEIRRAQRLLEESSLPADTKLRPLYGELSASEQDAAVRPAAAGERKVVLATNIAETSLTIEGVRIVVDSGLMRRARFDPATGMSRLETLRISRASAEQRRGRAGRLEPGVCYRLWSQAEHESFPAHLPAEILEADLAPLALDLAQWGTSNTARLRWLDAPPAAAYAQARDLLASLGALQPDGRISEHGRNLARLGTHPRLAHMITRGAELGLQRTALEMAALLGERDLLRAPPERRNVDVRLRLEALHLGRSPLPELQLDAGARQRALRGLALLERQADRRQRPSRPSETAEDDAPGRLLACAYPDRIAQSRGGGRYVLASGRGARLPEGQPLAASEFLVVADLDAGEREALVRLAAPLSRTALELDFAARIEQRQRIEWEGREQAVLARHERWLDALLLDSRRIERPDPQHVLAALLAGVRELGLAALPWTKEARALQARLAFARRIGAPLPSGKRWPDVSDAALTASLEDWLAPWLADMSRREHLARLDLHEILASMLDWQGRQTLAEIAPAHLAVPSGSRIPIDYSTDPPSLSVRIQEVLGMRSTPSIGGGRVPLSLQLLSPAHRPVQITRDLASFWAQGYAEVKKELKGRYPKHYWPDDPLNAQATARAKPRRS